MAMRKFLIRRSRSSTVSSILAGLPPTSCFSLSIHTHGGMMPCFEPPVEAIDPSDHPFAALKALQADDAPASAKKDPKNPGDGKGR